MKNLMILSIALFLTMPLHAQSSRQNMANINQKIDALSAPVNDIEARYWASRVQSGSISIEKLEEASKGWLGSKEANQKHISLIKKYLKSGKKVSVTSDEFAKMDENKKKIREFLKQAEKDKKASDNSESNVITAKAKPFKAKSYKEIKDKINKKLDAISAPVNDIEARHWAYRVQSGEISIEKLEEASKGWLGSDKAKEKQLSMIKKHLKSKHITPLTKEEYAKMEEAQRKTKEFLNSPEANAKSQLNASLDNITSKVRDISARELALNVKYKIITFEQLDKYSKGWLGSREENKALLDLAKKYVQEGKTISITPEEWAKLDENKTQVRAFLNDGKITDFDKQRIETNKKIVKIEKSVFEIEARAWANNIAEKKTTFEELAKNSLSWSGDPAFNQKMINKIEENVKKGNTKKLNEKEKQRLNEAKQKIRELLNKNFPVK